MLVTGKLDAIEARIAALRTSLARRDTAAAARDAELLRAMVAELDRDSTTDAAIATRAVEIRTRAVDMLRALEF